MEAALAELMNTHGMGEPSSDESDESDSAKGVVQTTLVFGGASAGLRVAKKTAG